MLRPIDRGMRRAVVSVTTAIAIGGLFIVPLTGSGFVSQAHRRGDAAGTVPKRDDPWEGELITVTRDPFLSQSRNPRPEIPAPRVSGRGIIGMRVVRGDPILNGNSAGLYVRGIISGVRSLALVESFGVARIVSPGDYIGGARVQAIFRDRVVLTSGLTFMLRTKAP